MIIKITGKTMIHEISGIDSENESLHERIITAMDRFKCFTGYKSCDTCMLMNKQTRYYVSEILWEPGRKLRSIQGVEITETEDLPDGQIVITHKYDRPCTSEEARQNIKDIFVNGFKEEIMIGSCTNCQHYKVCGIKDDRIDYSGRMRGKFGDQSNEHFSFVIICKEFKEELK